jgi:hypothetical protein
MPRCARSSVCRDRRDRRLLRAERRHLPRVQGPLPPRRHHHLEGFDHVAARFKDDASEVRAGFECGIGLSDFQDLKPGDIIETYDEREIARKLS